MSPNENTEFIKEKKVPSKRHEFSFYRGYSDYNSFPIAEYDYYAILASLGKYNPDALPTADKVLTHDIPTTTALHFDVKVLTQSLFLLLFKGVDLFLVVQNIGDTL